MHALCRFFLEHSGPTHQLGDRTVLPFLVNMARLFELFVAEWLKTHLPENLTLKAQEKVAIGEAENLKFNIDLVLSDVYTGKPICVLDTKYKTKEGPDVSDIAQVVTYAEVRGCPHAILVYPQPLFEPLDVKLGDIRVQSLTFPLAGDLEEAGLLFRDKLIKSHME
jgi:5-methylcytosine-specific restriction enzyme subunit McrC